MSWTHPAACTICTRFVSRGKVAKGWCWSPPPYSTKLKTQYSYTSTPPLGLYGLFWLYLHFIIKQCTRLYKVELLAEEDLEGKCPGLIEVVTELAFEDKSSDNVLLNLPHKIRYLHSHHTNQLCALYHVATLPINLYHLWNVGQLHIKHTPTVFDIMTNTRFGILLHVTVRSYLGNANNAQHLPYTGSLVGHFLPATTSHFLCLFVSSKYEECSVPWVIKIK